MQFLGLQQSGADCERLCSQSDYMSDCERTDGYDRTDVDRTVSARADSLGLQPPTRAWLAPKFAIHLDAGL